MTDGLDPRIPFTVASLAERWGRSEGAVRNLFRASRLPHFRIGTLIRIPAAEVEKFEIASRTDSYVARLTKLGDACKV
ncbi:helix-turn-helix domain-containing protein [Sphingomonas sp. STIS6.2]|uniref:helix-turn-helix domain-containing protein n=1 Tax=Sphingomonas sp. STIS6.2 TaxID=1379700 RepID=UPI003FA379FB